MVYFLSPKHQLDISDPFGENKSKKTAAVVHSSKREV